MSPATGATPIDDINTLRQRSSAAPLVNVTLNEILIERQRELAFEGFGIYDIKRTQSSVAGIPYDSPRLVIPIPQGEMDTNPLMEQNEGY